MQMESKRVLSMGVLDYLSNSFIINLFQANFFSKIRIVYSFKDPNITPLTKYFCRNG
jgi:hypothetical protein